MRNKEAKATPAPTILGRGGSGMFNFQCEGEAAGEVSIWAEENQLYNIPTDTTATFDLDEILFNWMAMQ